MEGFFILQRERSRGSNFMKKQFYDIRHIDRVTFVTLEIYGQIRDTLFIHATNYLMSIQSYAK
jgi:hypothetical protein